MAKGEAWREGSGCGGRDGADCGERGDARVLLCQALSCGSCGLQSTHDWEAEGVAGDRSFQALGHRSWPWLSGTQPWCLGQGTVAWRVRTTEEVVGCGLWVVGLHLKGALQESCPLCRKWAAQGAVPLGSARPRCQHIRKQKLKNTINTPLLLWAPPFSSFQVQPKSHLLGEGNGQERLFPLFLSENPAQVKIIALASVPWKTERGQDLVATYSGGTSSRQ